jgi:phenylalanyl-tRNA synthetase beta chain
LSAYKEEYQLGMWITGKKNAMNWAVKDDKTTFYLLKAHVQNVLTRMGIDIKRLQITESQNYIFSESIEMRTVGGKLLATIGIVSPKILKSFDIDNEVFFANLEWKQLLKENGKHKISNKEISKFPEVKRDLALLIDKSVTFGEIERIAYDTEKKLLTKVSLFDVYEGKNLEEGKKSYAVNFTLQDTEKTLNDKQIDAIMQKLIKVFTEKLGAKLR